MQTKEKTEILNTIAAVTKLQTVCNDGQSHRDVTD